MSTATVRLGDVATFVRGITFKPADVLDEVTANAVGCMRTKNVQSQLDETDVWFLPKNFVANKNQVLQEGDLLVSTANSWNLVGKACWVPKLSYECTFGGFISALRATDALIDRRYLYYWFTSEKIQEKLRSFGNKTTNISNLSIKRANDLVIPLPPLAEQKRIAALLDITAEIKAKREQAIAKLDEFAQSTFVEMFGDDVSPVKNLFELGNVKTGGTPPSSMDDMFGDEIPFVTPGDLGSESRVKRYLTVKGAQESVTVKAGSSLVCCIGATIGKMDIAQEKSAFNQQINAVEWNDEIADIYGFYALKSIKNDIIKNASSTTLPILKKSLFQKLKIKVPPISKQHEFVKKISSTKQLVSIQKNGLIKAELLCASLQHQAFTTGFNA